MSLKKKYLKESVLQIKEFLGVGPMDGQDLENKDIYLKNGQDLIGLHTTGVESESGFYQYDAWCNVYTNDYKFLRSIYRFHCSIEDEAADLKKEGWVVVPPPPPGKK
jgi:hypothetical protein